MSVCFRLWLIPIYVFTCLFATPLKDKGFQNHCMSARHGLVIFLSMSCEPHVAALYHHLLHCPGAVLYHLGYRSGLLIAGAALFSFFFLRLTPETWVSLSYYIYSRRPRAAFVTILALFEQSELKFNELSGRYVC